MFFDNASTTKIDDDIICEFAKLNNENFYNAGALYLGGRESKTVLNNCRKEILDCLGGGMQDNIIFTGSATESNNLALFGFVRKNTRKILVSMGEHPSVYNVALELAQRGYKVEFVNLDKSGKVDIQDFENKMTSDVDLVSIMHISNETGAVNDIAKLVQIAKDINPKVVFHCDGVQAVGKIPVDLSELGVDMYTMSAHKIHGMKGVGALYIKKGVSIKPIIFGGGQEGGYRSGTENILGIYSLAKSVKKSTSYVDNNYNYVLGLKKQFIKLLSESGLKYSLHSFDDNSPYIVSVSFDGCRAETILNMLDDRGICVGNGSACSSKTSDNRVLDAMGVGKNEITSNLRISFSRYNTENEVNILVKELKDIVCGYLQKV